jgi:hypothetical protein
LKLFPHAILSAHELIVSFRSSSASIMRCGKRPHLDDSGGLSLR